MQGKVRPAGQNQLTAGRTFIVLCGPHSGPRGPDFDLLSGLFYIHLKSIRGKVRPAGQIRLSRAVRL